ncbi:hypothetical protein CMQ_1496 [Grosmannia clavigera kw1407]|uniref:Uncharacterized protein n=1 Tax=Grosmannia clavigera (strain kw1407 / UAMH 11150) TaxID=655863 RepID=F0XCD7_GROCL|nr:uncharacterized protein CMQ_1496 [Grosmannia clavigera kw1407]EFX04568.1 hypothetical protein CMQ_1496 [Grosmannia clavigera kw1407]
MNLAIDSGINYCAEWFGSILTTTYSKFPSVLETATPSIQDGQTFADDLSSGKSRSNTTATIVIISIAIVSTMSTVTSPGPTKAKYAPRLDS